MPLFIHFDVKLTKASFYLHFFVSLIAMQRDKETEAKKKKNTQSFSMSSSIKLEDILLCSAMPNLLRNLLLTFSQHGCGKNANDFSRKINSEPIRTYPLSISIHFGEISAYLPQLGKMSRSDRRGISVATSLRSKK